MLQQTTVEFEGVSLPVKADPKHVWLMPTKDVAKGFGVDESTVRSHRGSKPDELVEGRHWIRGVGITNPRGGEQPMVFWTKAGIVRLGFFIKSERAKKFRDFAEELVVDFLSGESLSSSTPPASPLPANPLTLALRAALENQERIEVVAAQANAVAVKADALEAVQQQMKVELGNQPIDGLQAGNIRALIYALGRKKGNQGWHYGGAFSAFKFAFGLASYKDLPRRLYEEATTWLEAEIERTPAPRISQRTSQPPTQHSYAR